MFSSKSKYLISENFENRSSNNSRNNSKNKFETNQYEEKFENYMNISNEIESNDIQNYEFEISKKIDAHLTIFEFFLICQNCNMMFYFNNKLHKHLKTFCKKKIEIDANFTKKDLQKLSVIEFFKKNQNHKNYDFRSHQYATIKMTLSIIDKLKNLCIDFETFMFLINRKFVDKELLEAKILTIRSFIKVKKNKKQIA